MLLTGPSVKRPWSSLSKANPWRMRAGEAAFSRRDFAEALKDYEKALELEPSNYAAVLFIGNTYHKQNQFAQGAEWYERAIRLDPNVETAYRYYADMLAKEGDMAKARKMLILAAVAEPYNKMVWRELHAWATLNNTHINQIYVGVPAPRNLSTADQQPPDVSTVWQAYREVRAKWQAGGQFKKRFPDEKEYRHSLPEESEALTATAEALEKMKADKKIPELVATNQPSSLLLKLRQAGMIEPYGRFRLICQDKKKRLQNSVLKPQFLQSGQGYGPLSVLLWVYLDDRHHAQVLMREDVAVIDKISDVHAAEVHD